VHAPLQIPALAVLHGSGAELNVNKLAHFPQLTPGPAEGGPGPRATFSERAAGRRTMRK
jgi:hypothetical protein